MTQIQVKEIVYPNKRWTRNLKKKSTNKQTNSLKESKIVRK